MCLIDSFILMKTYKCSKCKSSPKAFVELWGAGNTIVFQCDENGEPQDEGDLCIDSAPYGVEERCICGHQWRLRGVSQITELRT